MTHPLSLAFLTVFDVGPVAAIQAAAAAGYDRIGLRLLPAAPGEADYPLMTDDDLLAQVQKTLHTTGITVGDVEIIRLNTDPDWPLFARFCQRAQALGAKHVLVAGDDPDPERLTASFARFCDLAALHGLTADLEFMPWTRVPDLATARHVVETAARANGGVLIDALHLDRAGSTLAEVAALPRHLINYVQFCDGPRGFDSDHAALIRVARCERLLPGEGGIDLAGLARVIPPDVPISLEIPNRQRALTQSAAMRATQALAALRRIIG